MAAPKFSPVDPTEVTRYYESPDHVPSTWTPTRPGEIAGFQPTGDRLGAPGPDQGFAIKIANSLRPRLQLQHGEHEDDVVRGCLGVGLRRASLFSRAPVVHDLNLAFSVWGFYDETPATELVELRSKMFEGLRHVGHHYTEARLVVDAVSESTLRLTVDEASAAHAADWRSLLDL